MAIKERFIIGDDWPGEYPLTDEHRAELKERAGVDKLAGYSPYEIVTDEAGRVFYRSLFDKDIYTYFEAVDDSGAIMCQCGNKAYEVTGTDMSGITLKCTNCGNVEEFSW